MCPLLTEEKDGPRYHEVADAKTRTRSISPQDSFLLSLENAVKPRNGEMLIELGCGSGLRSLHLAKKYSLKLVLIDWAKAGISLAKENAQRLGVTCDFIRCDLKHLPLMSEQFDIVWAEGTHEHVLRTQRMLAFGETRRIAKRGARLLIFVPNILNPIYRIEEKVKDRLRIVQLYEIAFSRSELAYWVNKSGFKITGSDGLEVFYTLFTYSNFDMKTIPPIIKPLYRIKRFITSSFYGREGISSNIIRSLRKLDRRYLPRSLFGHEVGIVAVAS